MDINWGEDFSDEGLAGLKAIASLPDLECLHFGNEHVTDAGIAELSRLPNLRELEIACEKVSLPQPRPQNGRRIAKNPAWVQY